MGTTAQEMRLVGESSGMEMIRVVRAVIAGHVLDSERHRIAKANHRSEHLHQFGSRVLVRSVNRMSDSDRSVPQEAKTLIPRDAVSRPAPVSIR
jgi:hypothetical protein